MKEWRSKKGKGRSIEAKEIDRLGKKARGEINVEKKQKVRKKERANKKERRKEKN